MDAEDQLQHQELVVMLTTDGHPSMITDHYCADRLHVTACGKGQIQNTPGSTLMSTNT